MSATAFGRWLSVAALVVAFGCRSPGLERDPLPPAAAFVRAPTGLSETVALQMRLESELEVVQAELAAFDEAGGWRERGYFSAAEHDRVELLLFRFLAIHTTLWSTLERSGGVELVTTPAVDRPVAHLLALHAGLLLADGSSFLVSQFADDPIAIAKLNESFYRTEIAADTYDQLRLATTSPGRRTRVEQAWALYLEAAASPDPAALEGGGEATKTELATIRSHLPTLYRRISLRYAEHASRQGRVEQALVHSRIANAGRSSRATLSDAAYRARSLLFKDASRLKSPTAHIIVFSAEQKRRVHEMVRPGDIILTYTAGYVSSVFIPGVYKHGITYVGSPAERAAAGIAIARAPILSAERESRFDIALEVQDVAGGHRADLIEAVAEGVKFSSFDQIMDTHINRMVILRPLLDQETRSEFLSGVFAFVGDPYDFRFDFADATKQVCTEVIYRALDGKGGIEFGLTNRGGHPTLSADDIARYHLDVPGRFEVVLSAERSADSDAVDEFAAAIFTGYDASERLRLQLDAAGGDGARVSRAE